MKLKKIVKRKRLQREYKKRNERLAYEAANNFDSNAGYGGWGHD